MRNIGTAAPVLPERAPGPGTWDLRIEAVTPIYKGGSNPKGIDHGIPFRGPSLKGLLRSWWRATQETSDVDTLRRQEATLFGEVFGDGQRASQVSVGVTELSSKPAFKPENLGWITWVSRNEDEQPFHAAGATARLRVRTQAEPAAIRLALQAMLLFGGVGSRSRRGLGALWADDTPLLPSFNDVGDLLRHAASLAPSVGRRSWPSLGGAHLAVGAVGHADALRALREAHDNFKAIRGMKSLGGRNFSGKERAPVYQDEWLAVRDMASGRSARPRGYTAALGMPLVYRSSNGHLPGTVSMTPRNRSRLPSPVLLKPMKVAGTWRACFVVLPLWALPHVEARHTDIGPLPADGLAPFLDALRDGRWGRYEVHRISEEVR